MARLAAGGGVIGVGDAGFVFWGLYVAFGALVAAYLAWMWWTERGDR